MLRFLYAVNLNSVAAQFEILTGLRCLLLRYKLGLIFLL